MTTEHAAAHLAALWRGALPDGLTVELRDLTDTPPRSAYRDAAALAALHDPATPEAQQRFVCYSLAAARPGRPVRDAEALLAPAAWLDIDVVAKAAKPTTAPSDVQAALQPVTAALAALPLPPHRVVYSGGGLHCYWLLLDPTDDMDTLREANRHLAAVCGGDAAATNPGRVLRLPGSWNTRLAAPVQCAPVAGWPVAAQEAEPTDLDALLDLPHAAGAAVRDAVAAAQAALGGAPVAAAADPASAAVAAAAASVSRNDWQAVEAAIKRGENWHRNGLALVAHWHQRGVAEADIHARARQWTLPGYTYDQTAREVQGFIDTAVAKYGAPVLSSAAGDAPDQALTYETWRAEHGVFDARNNKFVNLRTGSYRTHQAWELVHHHLHDVTLDDKGSEKRVRWIDRYKNDPAKTIIEGTDVLPRNGVVCYDEHGTAKLNLWRENPAVQWADRGDPDSEAVSLFRRLVLFLCDGRLPMAEHLFRWAACSLFRDDERIRWAVLMVSEQKGTGKSMASEVIRRLHYGPSTASLETLAQLTGKFSGWLAGKTMVTVQEVTDAAQGRFTAIEALKSAITEEWSNLEAKHRDPEMVRAWSRFWFLSNHHDALPFDTASERRIFAVVCTAKEPLPVSFYTSAAMACLSEQGLADIAAFLRQYSDRPLELRAPDSDTDVVAEALLSDWCDVLNQYAADKCGADGGVAVRGQDMLAIVRHLSGQPLRGGGVTEQLRRAGWRKVRRKTGRYWCWGDDATDHTREASETLKGDIVDGGSAFG